MRKAVGLCLTAGLLGLLSQAHAELGVSGEAGISALGLELGHGASETLGACLGRYGFRYTEDAGERAFADEGTSDSYGLGDLNSSRDRYAFPDISQAEAEFRSFSPYIGGSNAYGPAGWAHDDSSARLGLVWDDPPKVRGRGLDFTVDFRAPYSGPDADLYREREQTLALDSAPDEGFLKALEEPNLIQSLWEWSLPVTTFGVTFRY